MFKSEKFQLNSKMTSNLSLKMLPWNPDRDEDVEESECIVVHKNDPHCTWFRPRRVFITETNLWSLKKYLRDQDLYEQYTHEDMMVRLGYPTASWLPMFKQKRQEYPINGLDGKQTMDIAKPNMLSPQPLFQKVSDVLWANLHLCYKYRQITYISDELSNEEMSPYMVLIRSGDYCEKPKNSYALAYDELRKMRERDRQRNILYREAKLRDLAQKRFAQLRSSKQCWAEEDDGSDTTYTVSSSVSEYSCPSPTPLPVKSRRSRMLRAVTAPFRWLRKHI